MKISFAEPSLPKSGALVLFVADGRTLTPSAEKVDKATGGVLARAMAASRFKGEKGQLLAILAPASIDASRVILVGLGKPEDVTEQVLEAVGGKLVASLAKSGETDIHVWVETLKKQALSASASAARIAFGARLRAYRFDRYRTKDKPEDKPSLKRFTAMVKGAAAARKAYAPLDKLGDGVFLTRDLVSEPANVIYPESLAEQAKSLTELGVKVEILDEAKMKKLGMRALLAVGQGSEKESRLVAMRWNGAPKGSKEAPVALVGKGVTFDSGGISIKPAAGMEDMKWDMGGAAAVIGAMKALAGRKAKVDVVGVVGLVENMPSGSAQRPGDVVTSMSGQTIEVINTDAEGRLVLADALWYTQERFKPKAIIDLATLTGAIIISLAHEYGGLFSNNEDLAKALITAGEKEGEKLWRMPLGAAYDKLIDTPIADMKNTGGREGGSITAAQFLLRFIKDAPWAHLDVAGMVWSKADTDTVPKGGTGYGVRLLDRLIADAYEAK